MGIVQALFTALSLLIRKGKKASGILLSLFLICAAIDLFSSYTRTTSAAFSFRLPFIQLAYGPFFWLYLKSLINEDFRFHPKQLLHLIPVILVIYFTNQLEAVHELGEIHSSSFPAQKILTRPILPIAITYLISIISYSILILRQLVLHYREQENYFSSINDTHRLKWIRNVSLGYLLFMGGFIFIHSVNIAINGTVMYARPYLDLFLVIMVFLINYYGLQQPQLFHESLRIQKRKSTAGETNLPQFLKKLSAYMEKERPFLNPELTIQELADHLEVERPYLTRVLNDRLEKNFFAFINEYRVDEAKRRLADSENDHLTLLAVALDSGFNSKSSFNTVFKQYSGMTPSDFRKKR